MRLVSALVLLCSTVVLLAGCGGGELGPGRLANQSDAVQSLAAEGSLLAADSVAGKSTATFTSEHGGFLAKTATSVAASLAKAKAQPGLEPKLRRLRTLSADVRDQLKRLGSASPAEKRQIASRLGTAADEAASLSKSLG